ncbi:MAG: lipase [Gammaproteobacteria bacterium]|nr:lipase [Gammaproteobacteria bacterium]
MGVFTRFIGLQSVLLASFVLSLTIPYGYAAEQEAYSKVHEGVAKLGKQWNGEVNVATTDLFIELHNASDRSGVMLVSDISYGPHQLQVMDIVTPESESEELLPVVVFFHGGALIRGNKVLASTDLMLTNIPTFFARNGMIGVNANYRLAPEVSWPAGPEDVRDVLGWLRENIEQYGGDPQRLFVMGNSAGGRIVASYLFHEPFHFVDGPGVSGALLSSASFRSSDSQVQRDYYGDDPEVRDALVPLGLVDFYYGPQIPLFMWSAEFDPPWIEGPIAMMYSKLCEKYQDCPRFTQFQGHNHVSHIMSLNSINEEVGLELLEFIESTTH